MRRIDSVLACMYILHPNKRTPCRVSQSVVSRPLLSRFWLILGFWDTPGIGFIGIARVIAHTLVYRLGARELGGELLVLGSLHSYVIVL